MRQTIQSQLPICELKYSNQLSAFQVIGIVTDLANYHSQYGEQSVFDFISRLTPMLETGQAKIFFDDEHRPYGYASWVLIPERTHPSLMAGQTSETELAAYFTEKGGDRLWFYDFLCPFCSPLIMFQWLKKELANYSNAYLERPATGSLNAVRRLW
jgi:hemolysin-activating ACP:hemolysin acyltransferase